MRPTLGVAVLLALAARAPAQLSERSSDAGLDLELELRAEDPTLEARGACRALDYTARSAGTLHVWASSSELDPYLRVERADGRVFGEDEDGGGGTSAWLAGPVEAGEGLGLLVAAQLPGELGRVRVRVRELPETDAIAAAVRRARSALAESTPSLRPSDAAARQRFEEALDALLAVDGVLGSVSSRAALESFFVKTHEFGDSRATLRIVSSLASNLDELYAPGCAAALHVRHALAGALFDAGRTREALDAQRELVERRHALKGADPFVLGLEELQLGQLYDQSGDLEPAADWLASGFERIAALRPEGDPYLTSARAACASNLFHRGELEPARRTFEAVIDAESERGGGARAALLDHQSCLACVLAALGDKEAALELHRSVLHGYIELYGPQHELVAQSRLNVGICAFVLGATSDALDELREAELVLESIGGHAETLGMARAHLALVAIRSRDFDTARAVLDRARAQASELSPQLAWRLAWVGSELDAALGNTDRVRSFAERALETFDAALPNDAVARIELQRRLASIEREAGSSVRATAIARDAAGELSAQFLRAGATLALREAAAVATARAALTADLLDLLGQDPADVAAALALVEAARGLSCAASARTERSASPADAERVEGARRELHAWTRELARLSRLDAPDEMRRAVDGKERAERELRGLASASVPRAPTTPASVAAALPSDGCAIGFWRYDPGAPDALGDERREARLVAFVVRADGSARRIELGPCAPVRGAIEAWRAAVASGRELERARVSGEDLRARSIDPLRAAIGEATRWFVAPVDALCALPLDALPEGEGVLGDRVRVTLVPGLDRTRIDRREANSLGRLVVAGGIDYAGGEGGEAPDEAGSRVAYARDDGLIEALRANTGPAGFSPLEGTRDEIHAIAARFEAAGGSEVLVLESAGAGKAELERALPGARYLHVATHGFFAAADSELELRPASSASGLLDLDVTRPRSGFTALSRCGLALAGANELADARGELRGVITAEELSGLDLSSCELVVLSACDTGLGYLRAGQGVAGFQSALHAAGARHVVTTAWRVSDERARELMLEFYRGLWEEGLEPEDALWRAKCALRSRRAKLRDWAGWIASRDGG